MAKSFCPPACAEIANFRVFFQIGSNFLTCSHAIGQLVMNEPEV